MSRYIDPQGEATYGLAICGRCSRKFKLADLTPDPNSPGLMVCAKDLDNLGPYRLAPRAEDPLVLPFVRPDTPVETSEPSTPNGTRFTTDANGQPQLFIID